MSYEFRAWLDDEDAPTLEAIADHLDEDLPDRVRIDRSERQLSIHEGDWQLSGSLNDNSWVVEEAEEMIESYSDDMSDDQLEILSEASSRLEFHPLPEWETDDHYNVWLTTCEALAALPGVLVFQPFDATFQG
jgi:hypothetical protein